MNNSIGRGWRSRVAASLGACVALWLGACGGSDEPAGTASAPVQQDTLRSVDLSKYDVQRLALPDSMRGVGGSKIDPRLVLSHGEVEVWITLDQAPAATVGAQRAAELGLMQGSGWRELRTDAARKSAGSMATLDQLKAEVRSQRERVHVQQADLAGRLAALGARELGRVSVAHNAMALSVDAAALPALARLPGVTRVRPVMHYELDLSETVPYVGGTEVQRRGFDGRKVTVAILDSGIDYTHRNLGGAGTAAAYAAAYGANGALAGSRDGLFPTAKVRDGFDFVGEQWPNGPRTEDDDPIARGVTGTHGTHVADIVAGASLDGLHKGMAPAAELLAVKVCSAVASSCNGVALLKGVDYALDPNGDGDFRDAADVINLSLGSNYGQPEDDLSFALGEAVKLGVVVVASAGNGGNLATITGSPASEPGVISVAQTLVPSAFVQPLRLGAPAALAGLYTQTASLDWAPVNTAASGDVVFAGRGCPAVAGTAGTAADPYLADPAGKIVLIDRGTCSVSLKVDRAARAGARGVLLGLVAAGDPVGFSNGGGTLFVPSLVITQALANQIRAQLTAGAVVQASLDPGAKISLAASMASTSSRGPSSPAVLIKPEIGAPGASVSAVAGTATGEAAFSGTSGAAPMVSGAVALLRQAYPTRSPMQIKAMLMNNAYRAVYTHAVNEPGVLAPVARIGAGELRVDRALDAELLAWNPAQMSAALSYGYHAVAKTDAFTQMLRIENPGRESRRVQLAATFREDADRLSGAVRFDLPDAVVVPARGSVTVPVLLSVEARKLPDWAVEGADTGKAGVQLSSVEYDGHITLRNGDQTLAVPWHIVPRKASGAVAQGARGVSGALEVVNHGAAAAVAEVFALTGTSPQVPRNELPAPGSDRSFTDLQAVGVRLAAPGVLQFGIATFGRSSNPLYPAGYRVDIDTDQDGRPDFAVVNEEFNGRAASGRAVVSVFNYATATAEPYYAVDADLYSGLVILTAPLAAMGLTDDSTFSFSVTSYDNYFTNDVSETLGPMTFTPSRPRFMVAGGATQGIAAGSRATFTVDALAGGGRASPAQEGLLLLYRGNAVKEADLIVPR